MTNNLEIFEKVLLAGVVHGEIDFVLLANTTEKLSEEGTGIAEDYIEDIQLYLDCLELSDLSVEEVDAVIRLGKIHTHFVCTLLYTTEVNECLLPRQIDEIINLDFCEEDNGRSDSCYGAHFFMALLKNITSDQLRALLQKEHYDLGFFPWLIARSTSASKELLLEIARRFSDAHTWRIPGYYTEEDSLLDEADVIGSFVLIQLSKNPIVSDDIRAHFAIKLNFLANTLMKTKADLIQQQLIELGK
jgi:hypothetical protein